MIVPLKINDIVYVLVPFEPKHGFDRSINPHMTITKIIITEVIKHDVATGKKITTKYKYAGTAVERKIKVIPAPKRNYAQGLIEMAYFAWKNKSEKWYKQSEVYLNHKQAKAVKQSYYKTNFVEYPVALINIIISKREREKGSTFEESEKNHIHELPEGWQNSNIFRFIHPGG